MTLHQYALQAECEDRTGFISIFREGGYTAGYDLHAPKTLLGCFGPVAVPPPQMTTASGEHRTMGFGGLNVRFPG